MQTEPTIIYCNNSSTVKLSRNPVMHKRSKHIDDLRFYFLRDLVQSETIKLQHYCTLEVVVRMRNKLGIVANDVTKYHDSIIQFKGGNVR